MTKVWDDKIFKRIKNRGPNCTQIVEHRVSHGVSIIFCGAVLWMQGKQVTPQPLESSKGILLYNGDIFDETWDNNVSDTQLIMEKLSKCNSEEQMLKELKSFKGPFSIIFYNKLTNDLYFTRDRIGRNSMLLHKNNNSIVISSVLGRKYKSVEVPATYINILNLNTNKIRLWPWTSQEAMSSEHTLEEWLNILEKQQRLPDDEFELNFDHSVDMNNKDNVVEYIASVAEKEKCKFKVMEQLINNLVIKETVLKVQQLLEKSVEIRLKRQPNKCKDCIDNEMDYCNHCTVGLLFSGGLDCTILALICDKFMPKDQSIDLINVAFKKDNNSSYIVPDRITGRQSVEELKRLCPLRKWVLREINVPKEELEKLQVTVIGDLVYPRQTILDESLGSALWFAARGDENGTVSSCRVLLLGSGADELFGGYMRHRNAFKRFGWPGLSKELQLDWERISYRNLARDNRVICDHGRQPRMPYLDEDFTQFVLQLKPWLRCFPSESLGIGIGDKLMLRLVAFNLGLRDVATFPKRALQFGSRIANKKEKGSDLSKTFLDAVE